MSDTSFNHGANRHVAGAEHDVDSFTRHRTMSRSNDLVIKGDEWKKNGLKLWLHQHAPIVSVWHHQFYKVIEKKDDKEKLPIFFKWNCWEDEDPVQVNRFKRRRDGSRVHPPQSCPFCLFAEALRGACVAGEVKWTDDAFIFEGDNRANTKILRVGDFWNAFSSKDLDDDEVADLRRAGVNRKEAWKTSLIAKCEYVFVGADDDHLADGCRIVVSNTSISDAMQDAIKREQKRQGRDKGDPLKNPYLFEWTYDDRKLKFADQYGVDVLGKAPSEEVLKIIRDGEPADTSDLIAFGDADELRALMEGHAKLDPKLLARLLDASFPASESRAAVPDDAKREEPTGGKPAPAAAELLDCDHCGKATMRESDMACPACGAEYAEVGEDRQIVLAKRPCSACKTPIPLPAKIGEKEPCPKCKLPHREEMTSVDGGGTRYDWLADDPPPAPPAAPVRARRGAR